MLFCWGVIPDGERREWACSTLSRASESRGAEFGERSASSGTSVSRDTGFGIRAAAPSLNRAERLGSWCCTSSSRETFGESRTATPCRNDAPLARTRSRNDASDIQERKKKGKEKRAKARKTSKRSEIKVHTKQVYKLKFFPNYWPSIGWRTKEKRAAKQILSEKNRKPSGPSCLVPKVEE